ncbi:MAG: leucine-rich repeat domain-containing protein, partial [Clostridia bacterium]|nr:leucine-rich repeat domain-containing protein [Clostridia bacterium]
MKTKKKLILSLTLALALCVGVIFTATLSMSADDETMITASGTCGDNLTWTLTSDGTLTISGTGDMYDYYEVYVESGEGWESETEYGTAPWCDSAGEITSVIIEDGVTSIGEGAFWDCTSLESATISDSVTEIGLGAFYNCYSLTSITI